jgi:ornithine carbamoyltransferase
MNFMGQNLLSMADMSPDQITELLYQARAIKTGEETPNLQGKSLGMIFEKPSLRTRVSFTVAMTQMGGSCLELDKEIGIGSREPFEDVIMVLSRYFDALAMRTYSQKRLEDLAAIANIPVINALSDQEHPCQALADVLTISEYAGGSAGVELAYVGDANNVASSLAIAAASLGMNSRFIFPAGYSMPEWVVREAGARAAKSKSRFLITNDPRSSLQGANVVYTDVWVSMGQEEQSDQRVTDFDGYKIDYDMMSLAQDGAIFMHPMPAHYGEEVPDRFLIDYPRSVTFDQAENRLHVQKALLASMLQNAL